MQNPNQDIRTFFLKIGEVIAATEHGISMEALPAILSIGTEMDQPDVCLALCKRAAVIGCRIFENAEGSGLPLYTVMKKLATASELLPAHPVFRDVVLSALGRYTLIPGGSREVGEQLLKKGAVLSSLAGAAARAGVALSPALLKTMLLGTVTAGVGGGTLAWLANRHVNEDDKDVEATRQRAAAYRRMRQDIEGQLAAKGVTQS